MTKSEIYLRAAELIANKEASHALSFSCTLVSILEDFSDNSYDMFSGPARRLYEDLFGEAERNDKIYIRASQFEDRYSKKGINQRTIALLFMHEITKGES